MMKLVVSQPNASKDFSPLTYKPNALFDEGDVQFFASFKDHLICLASRWSCDVLGALYRSRS